MYTFFFKKKKKDLNFTIFQKDWLSLSHSLPLRYHPRDAPQPFGIVYPSISIGCHPL